MHNKNRIYFLVGSLISITGIILSTILVCKHGFSLLCSAPMGCSIDGVDGCKELGESSYSKIFGIPIAYFGLVYYSFLAGLFTVSFIKENEKKPEANHNRILLLFYASLFGLVIDGFLAYINFTKLIVPCLLCVYTYFVTVAIFIVSLVLRNRNKPLLQFFQFLSQGMIQLGSAIIITSVITGILYSFERTQSFSGTKELLLPPKKVQEFLADFRALKTYELTTKNIKTLEGNPDGYIVIHKFADFLCPHCYDTARILQKALERWPGRIVIYYRQFPLDSTCNKDIPIPPRKPYGDWRCNGALAAVCAADFPQFPSFYHEIFALQDLHLPIDLEQLERISKNTGIPWNKVYSCMVSPVAQNRIQFDIDEARKAGINSTPAIFINNKLVFQGTPEETYFFYLLDALVYEREGEDAYREFLARNRKE